MSFNIGDVVVVTKLAYDVYSKGFLVARGAPEQFREVVQELSVFKDALYQIRRQTENGSDLTYDDPVRSLIKRCLQTLSDFGDFIRKYEQLGQWIVLPCDQRLIIGCVLKHGATAVNFSNAFRGPKSKAQ